MKGVHSVKLRITMKHNKEHCMWPLYTRIVRTAVYVGYIECTRGGASAATLRYLRMRREGSTWRVPRTRPAQRPADTEREVDNRMRDWRQSAREKKA